MEKFIKDGHVGVLVSRGFGAGWSTWNRECPEILFDPYIVSIIHPISDVEPDFTLDKEEVQKIHTYCALKYPDAYLGGLDGLVVEWVPVGERFRIDEYDGSETLVLESQEVWVIA